MTRHIGEQSHRPHQAAPHLHLTTDSGDRTLIDTMEIESVEASPDQVILKRMDNLRFIEEDLLQPRNKSELLRHVGKYVVVAERRVIKSFSSGREARNYLLDESVRKLKDEAVIKKVHNDGEVYTCG